LPPRYNEACLLAEQGRHGEALRILRELQADCARPGDARLRALIENDLAVLAALEGRLDEAREGWNAALEADNACVLARLNRELVEAEISLSRHRDEIGELKLAPPPPGPRVSGSASEQQTGRQGVEPAFNLAPIAQLPAACPRDPKSEVENPKSGSRIAILSFLFNWPSTGGGNMHTAGLVEFLARAGYEVRHFFARFPAWGIGRVAADDLRASEAIAFDEAGWNVSEIQAGFRCAVDRFGPDYVAITDAWNMKPHLAEAMRGYRRFLLFQAQECICPLNNLRLLADGPAQVRQCSLNQLAAPELCQRCVGERGRHSGALHQCERALAAVGTPDYDEKLRRSLREAEAVLVLNPLTAAMLEPYAGRVCVVPWGVDGARFPWPPPEVRADETAGGPLTLFMAAVAGEFIKGFHVAHEACRLLRQKRSDFELVVTFEAPGRMDDFTRSVGWQSQAELPRHYGAADICLVPTIAQDGLSITSVEAMAAGIPVIASRIGGLPYTVSEGVTGLLFDPGDASDLACKIKTLLDDPGLRRRMGLAARGRFERDFTWEAVISRYWRPLLQPREVMADPGHGQAARR
jgi:glycosyltransferase involved in cell wall biosynthesis